MILSLGLALLLAAPEGPIRIEVLTGEGVLHAAGSRSSPGLTVRVVDELGNPAVGALVSFRLPDDGPGGAFVTGLATEIVKAGPDGRAVAPAVRWNALHGPVEIRVLAASGDSRAGCVVLQHLSEGPPTALSRPVSRRRWVYIAGIAGAGAAAGFLGTRSGSRAGSPPAATSDSSVDIGPPIIVIGKP